LPLRLHQAVISGKGESSVAKKSINVGIIGFGTVGTGTARILIENADIIKRRLGAPVVLKKISDLDLKRDRGIKLGDVKLTNDAQSLINDPDMNGTHLISKGLGIARGLLSWITALEVPVANEMLDPITPEYVADMISWGAIGARTTESQTHREMASGLSFPVGFKNGTDGNLQIAIDAMKSAQHPHSFLGINREGRTSIIQTTGNPDVHIVLRGGTRKPNYHAEDIALTEESLRKNGLFQTIMVDCSHGNSNKDYTKQADVLDNVIGQVVAGNNSISGIMIESFLSAGNQKVPADISQWQYGVSITDACIDWATTEKILLDAHARLKNR
jgi:3-deoxy-7-phosphoheptulonate synthase